MNAPAQSNSHEGGEESKFYYYTVLRLGTDIREDISARSRACIHNLWISGVLSEFITARGAIPPWISIRGARFLATVAQVGARIGEKGDLEYDGVLYSV
ncbi:hypothetical protein CEXT_624081 [Caerostris extrusa]|uniref:Uncharacterized protein n=1 Tax=Caerostris extrusa TaxID=172846 RepID=A0AAV4MXU9_CAEEX|nr:hypothetical protein CEXT_624081 [Caerostris extrusa]